MLHRILIVEEDAAFAEALGELLESEGYSCRSVGSRESSIDTLRDFAADIAFVGARFRDRSYTALMASLKAGRPDLLCVRVSDPESPTLAEAPPAEIDARLSRPPRRDEVLAILAHCGDILRMTRQNEEIQRSLRDRTEELENLGELITKLASCSNLDEFGRCLLTETARLLSASGGSIYMPTQGQLRLLFSLDPGHAPSEIGLPLVETSAFGRAMRARQPHLVVDVDSENSISRSGFRGYRTRSFVVIPLCTNRGAVKYLLSFHDKKGGVFDSYDLRVCRVLIAACRMTLSWVESQQHQEPLSSSDRLFAGDITRRAEELHHEQKMAAIGRLASGIANDFNNALTPILTNIYIMERSGLTAANAGLMEDIKKATLRAKDLIAEIQAFSREDHLAGFAAVRLDELVDEVAGLLWATLPSTVRIRVTIPKGQWEIIGQIGRLHQVILNLGIEAGQAVAGGGTLEFALAHAQVAAPSTGTLSAGEYIKLTVCSERSETYTTYGISTFFSANSAATGLGLSIVHGVVTAHGGMLDVHREGTTKTEFKIMLPTRRVVEDDSADDHRPARSGTAVGVRLLLVDDEVSVVSSATRLLRTCGFEVRSFQSSTAALEEFRNSTTSFDVAILDQNMPNMTGLNLARKLRRMRDDLGIVLISGSLDASLRAEAEEIGIHALLGKPYMPDQLIEAISGIVKSMSGATG